MEQNTLTYKYNYTQTGKEQLCGKVPSNESTHTKDDKLVYCETSDAD